MLWLAAPEGSRLQYWSWGLWLSLLQDGTDLGLGTLSPLQTSENWGAGLFMPVSLWPSERESCPWFLGHWDVKVTA